MLVSSAIEDAEVEGWRASPGCCCHPSGQQKLKPSHEEVFSELPRLMVLLLRMRLRAVGWLGPICLEADEVAEIETSSSLTRQQIMYKLLTLGPALAQGSDMAETNCAVVEGLTGGLYLGTSVAWKGKGVKFSIHGIQAAFLNAWQQGETQLRHVMVETPPCRSCRQFLRETWIWNKIKILECPNDKNLMEQGAVLERPLSLDDLSLTGMKGRLLGEVRRSIDIGKAVSNNLSVLAANETAQSYAPYSHNYAGAVVVTKNGAHHAGRYIECLVTAASVMAVEGAIVNLALSGGSFSDIVEIVLIETRGTGTQFSQTQKLATALGNVPFRFILV